MARGLSGITGIERVMANLNKELIKIEGRSLAGLIVASTIVRRDMDIRPPLIPIDTGNLRASWFVTPGISGTNPYVRMGFTASYALLVHESRENKNWKRPGSGPKFFEAALKRNKEQMLQAIAASARIR